MAAMRARDRMFHIKTDIRQFKCETRDKVEKLIRNWVIRPSDLIYNADAREWNPIGQHPEFNTLFERLESPEDDEPATVVTEERPQPDDAPAAKPNGKAAGAAIAEPAGDGVPAPPEAPEGVEGVIRDSDEITMMTEKTLDMMRVDSEEQADEPAPDGPPREARGVIIDPLEDTLDQPRDDAPAAGTAGLEEETTNVVPRDEVDGQPEPDEDTNVVDRDAVEGAPKDPEEQQEQPQREEVTLVEGRPKPAGAEDSEAGAEPDEAAEEAQEAEDAPADAAAKDGADVDASDAEAAGAEEDADERQGIPEEAFITDELPASERDDDEAPVDDLAAAGEDDADEASKARWRIVLAEDVGDEADWDDYIDGLRETDEFSREEIAEIVAVRERRRARKKAEADSAEAGEVAQADAAAEPVEVEVEPIEADAGEGPAGEGQADDEDLDELLDGAADLVGLERSAEADEEEAAGEVAEREEQQTPVAAIEPAEFVSEGYRLPLPYEVGPSEADIALGLKPTTVSAASKDETFPYPEPKHRDEVIVRRFELPGGAPAETPEEDSPAEDAPAASDAKATRPMPIARSAKASKAGVAKAGARGTISVGEPDQPRDQSLAIVLVFLGLVVLLVVGAIAVFG